jgi:hypothetical protein
MDHCNLISIEGKYLIMSKNILPLFIFALICSGNLFADKAETFQQAQELSVQTGKPILMEFVHED